jgi:hypothetical protein
METQGWHMPDPSQTSIPLSAYSSGSTYNLANHELMDLFDGDIVVAVVAQHLIFRCDWTAKDLGWRPYSATVRKIAEDMHMTYKQVRRGIEVLRNCGLLNAWRTSPTDQTLTFAPVLEGLDGPFAPDPLALQGTALALQGTAPLPYRASLPITNPVVQAGNARQAPSPLRGDDSTDHDDPGLFHLEDGPPPKPPIDLFPEFWRVYPKSLDRPAAMRAWKAAIKKAPPREIVDAAHRMAGWPFLPSDRTYIPYPATWLNNERWTDDLEVRYPSTSPQHPGAARPGPNERFMRGAEIGARAQALADATPEGMTPLQFMLAQTREPSSNHPKELTQ